MSAPPVTSGAYAANETKVYIYLTSTIGLNKAAACGVLANIQHESGFNHTIIGDNGTSYGLCQWHNERWENLRRFCSQNNLNSTTVEGQMAYLYHELSTISSYRTRVLTVLQSAPNTAQGAYDSAYAFCYHFEIPANKEQRSVQRGNSAKNIYWVAYSNSNPQTTPTVNKGNLIIAEARKHLGKPYVWGAAGPSSFDCSGFTYYVYKTAISHNWERTTAYIQWKNHGKYVKDMRAGDLVFFEGTYATGNVPNISHVGIATGNGTEFIHAPGNGQSVSIATLESNYYKSAYHSTKRILANDETYFVAGSNIEVVNASTSQTQVEYENAIDSIERRNLSSYESSGIMYGYLTDLSNGGEFKFYVPEYEVSIQPTWDAVNILGRSVTINGYNSTSSRSINVSLELVAGTGLYENPRSSSDQITDLHNDISFVQSLAYPDYSKALVYPPALVLLYLGPTLIMKGIVTDVRADYKKPYSTDLRPMYCTLSFTVTHVTDYPPDYTNVRNGLYEGSRSGILTNTNSTSNHITPADIKSAPDSSKVVAL